MKDFLQNRTSIKKSSDTQTLLAKPESNPDTNVMQPLGAVERKEELITKPEAAEIPKVQMITEDGSVKKILIECTCGKCLELECEYDDAVIDGLRRIKQLKR